MDSSSILGSGWTSNSQRYWVNKVTNYVAWWFLHPAAPPVTAGVTSCYCSLSVLLKLQCQYLTVVLLITVPTPSIATHQHIHSVQTLGLCHGSGSLSSASHHWVPGLIPVQFMWDLCWTKWQGDGFYSKLFLFFFKFSSLQCSIFFFIPYSPGTDSITKQTNTVE
jgi:hypothetical protein